MMKLCNGNFFSEERLKSFLRDKTSCEFNLLNRLFFIKGKSKDQYP